MILSSTQGHILGGNFSSPNPYLQFHHWFRSADPQSIPHSFPKNCMLVRKSKEDHLQDRNKEEWLADSSQSILESKLRSCASLSDFQVNKALLSNSYPSSSFQDTL
ncbi:hypothetical protein O6H91_04G021500 [Diphasiastrum complanatum]|uniref:Uncharacterized protein n=1 Tax=Diphasiastrum complanatum TaxID=34168 RepID=A0ACC2DUN0_DIPCM|nr:hypothetical protein O6H91_04G021500 [Diphasiastrum complanatum]